MNVGESTMADNNNDQNALFDVEKNAKTYPDFAERTQRIVSAFLERQKAGEGYSVADPVEISKMVMDASVKMMSNPAKFMEA